MKKSVSNTMATPPVTVTVKKNPSVKTENSQSLPQNKVTVDSLPVDSLPTEPVLDKAPESKDELIALYHTEPLALNNSINSKELEKVAEQRIAMYQRQLSRTEYFYTVNSSIRPTYMVQALKSQFVEYQQYQMVKKLDQRSILDLDKIDTTWKQLHIVDDLITDIVRHMPAQQPVGWQLTSVNKNHLKVPTVGRLRNTETIADQGSLNSYVLGHFGVTSYTYDRAYFIGHVMGYLFCCYYLAHLSISYGVTPLPESTVKNYDYASLETAKMVRLLHSVDVHCKRRIYQLAVLCARLSCYQLDKYVEKMLIAEVNEFDKKQQIAHLDMLLNQGLMPDMPDMNDTQDFPGAFGKD